MTDQEINVAIAEACGWQRWKSSPESKVVSLRKPTPSQQSYWLSCGNFITTEHVTNSQGIPDYCNDLNAMHAATTTLFKSHPGYYNRSFVSELQDVMGWCQDGMLDKRQACDLINATARQRAEAFMEIIGKRRKS